jgi:hypothetical protein
MQTIRDIGKRYMFPLLGLLATFVLLAIFSLLQHFLPSVLNLDIKWIAVATLPLLLALIFGGYVKVIKGFGIELEMRIEEPIISLDLNATEVLTSSPSIEKRYIEDLERLSADRKRKIARLRFISGRPNYYSFNAISAYIRQLPNLEYFEVIRPSGTFICLVPIYLFRENEEIQMNELTRFVNALQDNRIPRLYSQDITTFSVRSEQSIVEVLEMMRNQGQVIAVVLNSKGSALGLIKMPEIEKRISGEVLLEIKRKKQR